MLYKINKSNYHEFSIFEDNKLPARSYFIPYPDRTSADAVSLEEKRYGSPLVHCLNGVWDFKFFPRPSEVPDLLDTEKVTWDAIDVPACWQMRGYDAPFYVNTRYQFPFHPPKIPQEKAVGPVFMTMGQDGFGPRVQFPKEEYNFVGIYRKNISIVRMDKKYILSFLGVCSCMDLYVNGAYVGYSEGSHNTAEFSITTYLHSGENEILLVVHRWCNGTYLECQDMFRHHGIFRDVLLREEDEASVWDIAIETKKEQKAYDLCVRVTLQKPDEKVTVSIKGDTFDCRKESVTDPHGEIEAEFLQLPVVEWNAEQPKLYDLYIETGTECIKCRVGFRNIRICENVYYWNEMPIKFHGVNHHDTSSENGYYMTPAEIEKDIRLCKEYNIDTIRTSHYPPDPYLLELCDEMGLYVIDEADLETHGALAHRLPPSFHWISHDKKWKEHYLDRARRLYHRDKLHPSIMLWSLGNESGGYHNTDAMYAYLKSMTDVPIHYESVIHSRRKAYDVGSQMYPSLAQVHKVGTTACRIKELNDRPYIMCEYAHAMGVGPGNMEAYWQEIYEHQNLMGGCVWEMVDHAIRQENGNYTYGGDHGEWEHDSNFCVDGIFYPDRTPSTGAYITAHVYRPLRVRWLGQNKYEIYNTKGFTHGNAYQLNFSWDGSDEITVIPDVAPLQKIQIELSTPVDAKTVIIRTVERATGRLAATEEIFLVPPADALIKPRIGKKETLDLKDLHLTTSICRCPTDNDKNILGLPTLWGFLHAKERILSDKTEGQVRIVKSHISCLRAAFICKDIYRRQDDVIYVRSELSCVRGHGFLPRFGKTYILPKDYTRVEYYGRQKESYADMKEQSIVADTKCQVWDMVEPNIRPQESGNRMDCSWVSLSDGKEKFYFVAEKAPFELGVKPYSDPELLHMKHREDEKNTGTYVTIQAFQQGIGTGSCGPGIARAYRYPMRKKYVLSFAIVKTKADDLL